jgi:hypothetical protein
MTRIALIAVATVMAAWTATAERAPIEIGPLTIGGAIRANYVQGDYVEDGSDAPQRGGNGGNFELDVFRINLSYEQGPVVGKAEYRWYNGYNFLHTGWIGYNFEKGCQVQVGLNRVPFGVGAYGPANSWFFDQHYYVGLSDDMDYGIKYVKSFENLTLDLAYYVSAENSFNGASSESARYSYDLVDNGSEFGHYKERNQVNVRAILSVLQDTKMPTDVGISAQWGEMIANEDFAEDSDAYAASVHSKTTVGNAALMLQLTQYKYDAKFKDTVDTNGMVVSHTDDLITMGAYDFAWPVASEGMIPSVAVSYTIQPQVAWIDSITFYNDYSVIVKDGELSDGTAFNDSALNVTGMAIAKDGWYIYVDYAYSSGNYFVGNEDDVYGATYADSSVGDFGANLNDDWKGRFNINFGYYF